MTLWRLTVEPIWELIFFFSITHLAYQHAEDKDYQITKSREVTKITDNLGKSK